MIFGFDTENTKDGRLLLACLCSRNDEHVVEPGIIARMELTRQLMLRAEIEPVQVWTFNLEYDLVNLWGKDVPDTFQLQFGRHRIAGARMKGAKVAFYEVGRFIARKTTEDVGEMFKMPKLKVDMDKIHDGSIQREILVRYCMRDAQIARKAGEACQSQLAHVGVSI